MFTRNKNTWQMVLHVILRVWYTLDNYTTDLFNRPDCVLNLNYRYMKKSISSLRYIFAQSDLLCALLFVIMNIYSVYSIYFGVGYQDSLKTCARPYIINITSTNTLFHL